jgi:hypothetical protein
MTITAVQVKDIANIIHLGVRKPWETRPITGFQVERCQQTYAILPLSSLLWGITLPGLSYWDLDQNRPAGLSG